MSGYAPLRVLRYLEDHGTLREDGRVMRFQGRSVPESYRNTIDNWRARGVWEIDLARWDEMLIGMGVMLWEYEDWECRTYGDLSFRESCG